MYLQTLSGHYTSIIQIAGWLTLRITDSVELPGAAHKPIRGGTVSNYFLFWKRQFRSAFRETPEHFRYHRGMGMPKDLSTETVAHGPTLRVRIVRKCRRAFRIARRSPLLDLLPSRVFGEGLAPGSGLTRPLYCDSVLSAMNA